LQQHPQLGHPRLVAVVVEHHHQQLLHQQHLLRGTDKEIKLFE
jgi:hypothetical protein